MSQDRKGRRNSRANEDLAREVDEELDFHLAEIESQLIAEGFDPTSARAEAIRRFGDLEGTRTYCLQEQRRRTRSNSIRSWIEGWRTDHLVAIRALLRARGYSAIVIATLALGIGANTVVFSVWNPFFLRALPFTDADRLVQLGHIDARFDWDMGRFSLEMMEDYRDQARSLAGVAAYHYGSVNLTPGDRPVRTTAGYFAGDMFGLLGADAAFGRALSSEESGSSLRRVVLSHGIWERIWGADPALVNQSIEIDGTSHTVVGVMPPDFNFPYGEVELWLSMDIEPGAEARDRAGHHLVARLNDGWSLEQTREELNVIHTELAALHPNADGVFTGVSVTPLREALNFVWDELRLTLVAALIGLGLVLAIACVNVASLTLARGQQRLRAVSVRAALGAGRTRIIRHLVAESTVLAAVGGAIGIAAAFVLSRAIDPLVPAGIFRVGGVQIDTSVMLFSLAVTFTTPLVFGLIPALQLVRVDLNTVLRTGTQGPDRTAVARRRALIVLELAAAIALVSGTGLMVRSVAELESVELGYAADEILSVEMSPPDAVYPDAQAVQAFFGAASERIEALPGVRGVGRSDVLPMNHETMALEVAPTGSEPDAGSWPTAVRSYIDEDYLTAMGTPLLAGRAFGPEDREGDLTVLISRSLAERHFPSTDPVGRSLTIGSGRTEVTVAGVVDDIRFSGFGSNVSSDHIYLPLSRRAAVRQFMVVRTEGRPGSMVSPVRAAVREVDPNVPAALRPLRDIVRENTLQWAASSLFLGILGFVAILLACLGIFGLVTLSVTQRRREIGVRMALGAARANVRRMLVVESLRLVAVASIVGLAATVISGSLLTRVVDDLFYGVAPYDPWNLVGVVVLFAAIVSAATIFPARHASKLHPTEVFRTE